MSKRDKKIKKPPKKPRRESRVVGSFSSHPDGFGFVVPDSSQDYGDLFIPAGNTGSALSGDRVVARVRNKGKRRGKMVFFGEVVEILERGTKRCVGTLEQSKGAWFLMPDGRKMTTPVLIRKISGIDPFAGAKVVVDIQKFPDRGNPPEGVVVEALGASGDIEAETRGIMRAFDLDDEFSKEALTEADRAKEELAAELVLSTSRREDLSHKTIVTIDPDDARDFDDAVSLEPGPNDTITLGVHIADVAHFVKQGTALDNEALMRGTSVYFPRKVVPMLPEVLSNGVCSLKEGESRLAKSVFITYDTDGNVLSTRFSESVILSTARLTYKQAQSICDGNREGKSDDVTEIVRQMEVLARRIERRRNEAGMLHLDLPEVELIFDEDGKVVDGVPSDSSYSHTIIEMFMVEANEAVAAAFNSVDVPIIRRVHADPDEESIASLEMFVRACGHALAKRPTRHDLQELLESVKGRPHEYAINLAVLRSFSQAEYRPEPTGHFALASEHYCHFTSPIRRYPDLAVHRSFTKYCRGELASKKKVDVEELTKLAEHSSKAERTAQAAENELRLVLVLHCLKGLIGQTFDGVITGVSDHGLFVQWSRFLVEGMLRLSDLGDEWWEVEARYGMVRGERSGRVLRIGDVVTVSIEGVDIAKRHLNLTLKDDLTKQ